LVDVIKSDVCNWKACAMIHARDTTSDCVLDRVRADEDTLHLGAEMQLAMQAL
jgi:hypothetical protein